MATTTTTTATTLLFAERWLPEKCPQLAPAAADPARPETLDADAILPGFQAYCVEQWLAAPDRALVALVVKTNNDKHRLHVARLRFPRPDASLWLAQVASRALADRLLRVTTPLGDIFAGSLANVDPALTLIPLPHDGDLARALPTLWLNLNLKRLGCGTRAALTAKPPTDAQTEKLFQSFKLARNPKLALNAVVAELVAVVQCALILLGLLPHEFVVDGCLCDATLDALRAVKDGTVLSPFPAGSDMAASPGTTAAATGGSVGPSAAASGSTEPATVVCDLSAVMTCLIRVITLRTKLSFVVNQVTKDPFSNPTQFQKNIASFQRSKDLPLTKCLDPPTVAALDDALFQASTTPGRVGKLFRARLDQVRTAVTLDNFLSLTAQVDRTRALWHGSTKRGTHDAEVEGLLQGGKEFATSLLKKSAAGGSTSRHHHHQRHASNEGDETDRAGTERRKSITPAATPVVGRSARPSTSAGPMPPNAVPPPMSPSDPAAAAAPSRPSSSSSDEFEPWKKGKEIASFLLNVGRQQQQAAAVRDDDVPTDASVPRIELPPTSTSAAGKPSKKDASSRGRKSRARSPAPPVDLALLSAASPQLLVSPGAPGAAPMDFLAPPPQPVSRSPSGWGRRAGRRRRQSSNGNSAAAAEAVAALAAAAAAAAATAATPVSPAAPTAPQLTSWMFGSQPRDAASVRRLIRRDVASQRAIRRAVSVPRVARNGAVDDIMGRRRRAEEAARGLDELEIVARDLAETLASVAEVYHHRAAQVESLRAQAAHLDERAQRARDHSDDLATQLARTQYTINATAEKLHESEEVVMLFQEGLDQLESDAANAQPGYFGRAARFLYELGETCIAACSHVVKVADRYVSPPQHAAAAASASGAGQRASTVTRSTSTRPSIVLPATVPVGAG
ncbi:hypothetical protein GGF31_000300 [Allomyces arbusculus]|nr:hypothetical protein GGF31_000300 [Allomyces arbusculus]